MSPMKTRCFLNAWLWKVYGPLMKETFDLELWHHGDLGDGVGIGRQQRPQEHPRVLIYFLSDSWMSTWHYRTGSYLSRWPLPDLCVRNMV